MLIYNHRLQGYARKLRLSMTDAEACLWSRLRRHQIKGFMFSRQRIIDNYIVDFFCPAAKLVIEVDGGQHFSSEKVIKDKAREDCLHSKGLRVLRFTDTDVLISTDAVVECILNNLEKNPLFSKT
jgi:very-short-patch-repair endonuclease